MKEDKPVAAIDFDAYRAKLTFTGAGVDKIEVTKSWYGHNVASVLSLCIFYMHIQPMLKNVKLPEYTAVIPDFEKNQRAELVRVHEKTTTFASFLTLFIRYFRCLIFPPPIQMSILDTATEAARVELNELYAQRDDFESNVRVTQYTTMADIRQRFPDIARSNEDEINQHLWFYNKETTRQNLLECMEDNQEAHCKEMGDTSGFNLKTSKIETVIGEDSYCAKETKEYILDP